MRKLQEQHQVEVVSGAHCAYSPSTPLACCCPQPHAPSLHMPLDSFLSCLAPRLLTLTGSVLSDFLFLASAQNLVMTSLSTFVVSAMLLNQRLQSLNTFWFRNATSGYVHVLEVCCWLEHVPVMRLHAVGKCVDMLCLMCGLATPRLFHLFPYAHAEERGGLPPRGHHVLGQG